MTIALKEIHISNEKKRDANVRFVSLIKENDPKLAYKGKSIKNSRLLISSDETSEESLIKQYKSKLAENILNNDVDIDIEYAITKKIAVWLIWPTEWSSLNSPSAEK